MVVRNLARNAFRLMSYFFSQDSLIKISNQKIALPFYHAVSNSHLPHISNLYTVRKKSLFIKDLDFLCKYYIPITLEELNNNVRNGNELQKPVFHLSFDDGLREIYTEIAPILESKGIPATFFLNSAFVDNKELFFRYKVSLVIEHINNKSEMIDFITLSDILTKPIQNKTILIKTLLELKYTHIHLIDHIALIFKIDFKTYLLENQPYLNSNEIHILLNKGFTFGSHSIDHPHLKLLSFEEQKRQIIESSSFLAQNFQIKEKYFSFPFSDEGISNKLFKWLFEIEKFELTFGISGLKKDTFSKHLHRIPMEVEDNPAASIIKSEYLYYLLKGFFKKNQILRND